MLDNIGIALHAATDVGKVREKNEDSIVSYCHPSQNFAYLAIADGMGGYLGGAMASQIAVTEIEKHFHSFTSYDFFTIPSEQQEEQICATVQKALLTANQKIIDAKIEHPECFHMGTTAVVVVILNKYLVVAHVGDSRAYLWTQESNIQLTKDHSVVQEMIEAGVLSEDEAKVSPVRNHITRALGVNEQIEIEMEAYILNSPALIMLCSDGVTEYLSNTRIEQFLAANSDIAQTCSEIINHANLSGGKDNISVGLIQFNPSNTIPNAQKDPLWSKDSKNNEDATIRRW